MALVITVFIVIVCFAIVGIVVIQNPKGGGINSGFGSVNQIAGVKQMTDGVEKITWMLALGLFVLCLASAYFFGKGQSKQAGDVNYNTEATPETSVQPDDISTTGSGLSAPTK